MRLCYVDERKFLWFTDTPIQKVWGDDWDDAPYEHNAGEPYLEYGPFEKLIIDHHLERPGENELNSRWSVEQINAGAVAWLVSAIWDDKKVVIPAGIEKEAVLELCARHGIPVYELKRDLT